MKRKLLFISMCMPYDRVAHAGGKTFNYYIKAFAEEEQNDVVLIAKVLPSEKAGVNTLDKNIKFLPVAVPETFSKKVIAYAKSLNSKINPWYKYGNTLTKDIYDQIRHRLLTLKEEAYSPDIIVLEWTEMLLFAEEVKKIFPSAKYVASEHDVSFLRLEREKDIEENRLVKYYRKVLFQNVKKRELTSINKCDFVVTHNEKDYKLLVDNGIASNKLGVIVPYYDDFSGLVRENICKNILFYGAMNREENSSAAIWFIEQVMPLLADYDVRFIIVGNRPPKSLLDKQSKNVIVTGFVEDVAPYFSNAMCMVAPLFLGAGVKVKIIEALSAGIPVLTNAIGCEGIAIEDKKHYYHCTGPNEYAETIRGLVCRELDAENISSNARKFILEKYDLEKSFRDYSSYVYSLLKDRL